MPDSSKSGKARLLRGIAGMALILALPLCLNAAPVAAQQLDKVKVSAVKVSSIGPLLIAQHQGYFKDQGIEADIDLFDSGQTSVLAVVSGSDDIAAGALTASLFSLAAKGGMKIIAGQVFANDKSPSGGLVASNAAWDAGMRSPKDIVGKRISITTTGGPAQYELGLIGEKYGFTVDQVTLVSTQSTSNLYATVVGNQVDGAITGVPTPERLEAEHKGHILAWASTITPHEEGAVFANAKTLAARPDVIKRYLAAYSKGCDDYNAAMTRLDDKGNPIHGPGYDVYSKLVADALSITPDKVDGTYPLCAPGLKLDMHDLGNQLSFWQSAGAVDKSVKIDDVVNSMVK